MKRIKIALDRLAGQPPTFRNMAKAVGLFILLRLTTPTPAYGFLLGVISATILIPLMWASFPGQSLGAIAVSAILLVGLAVAWQLVYDAYWEERR